MCECSTRGCHEHGVVTWPLLGDVTLCDKHYDHPTPQFASLVAEFQAPPDDFDIPDEFDWGPDPGTWRTREGEDIPYKELENSHLLNIVAMLERKFKPDGIHAMVFGLAELRAEARERGLSV